MSVLTGPEIERVYAARQRLDGAPILPYIDVSPWPGAAGPNSLDVHLGPEIRVYTPQRRRYYTDKAGAARCGPVLSSREAAPTAVVPFPETGMIFVPGVLYLGHTLESVECHGLLPWIDGRSSIGRLSVSIHQTAGRADDGWVGQLTLEISVIQPTELFPGDRIGQLTFFTLTGERRPYSGRYAGSVGAVASRMSG